MTDAAVTAPRAELRLHLGAHKTGSTHLSRLLRANEALLAERGLQHVPKMSARALFYRAIRAPREHDLGPEWQDFRTRLAKAPRTLICEEELLGPPRSATPRTGIYANAPERLSLVLGRLGVSLADTRFFIAIRNPATHFVSAWCEANVHDRMPPFRKWLGAQRLGQPYWSRLVQRLRDAFPEVPISVWTFERYVADPTQVLAMLLDAEPGDLGNVVSVPGVVRPGASLAAIREIQRRRSTEDGLSTAQAEAILSERPKGQENPGPDPFTDPEKVTLLRGYERDLEMLSSIEGVRFCS